MRNLTPSHLRCSTGGCPSLTQLEDGRLLIVGKDYNEDAAAQLEVFNTDGIRVSNSCDEAVIVIDPALLADYISQHVDAAVRAERERCARIADDLGDLHSDPARIDIADLIAIAIRSRGGS